MSNLSYSDKIIIDLENSTYIDQIDLNSIRRILRQIENKVIVANDGSITIDRFIEKSLDYLCIEHMTICRDREEIADVMTLKRYLSTIKNGLNVDEAIVDRFNSIYL